MIADVEKFSKYFLLSNTITFKNDKGEEQIVLSVEAVSKLMSIYGYKVALLRDALTHLHGNASDSDKTYIESILGASSFDRDMEVGVPVKPGDLVEFIDPEEGVKGPFTVEGNEDICFINLPTGETYMVGVFGFLLDLPNIQKREK
jgi:hypothetical protein